MAHRLMAEISQFSATGADWSRTGAMEAMEAGGLDGAPHYNSETSKISHSLFAPVATSNWSRTGADWSSKGASAPVVYTPLKGGYKPNWSSAPVTLQDWSNLHSPSVAGWRTMMGRG